MKPFEGLLGNNCELRILEFLLPLNGIEFNVTELAEEVGVSRPSVTKTIKKFLEWDLIRSRKVGSVAYYSIVSGSPIIKNIQQLNNLLIEKMLGDDTLYEIHEYMEDKNSSFEAFAPLDSLNKNLEPKKWPAETGIWENSIWCQEYSTKISDSILQGATA